MSEWKRTCGVPARIIIHYKRSNQRIIQSRLNQVSDQEGMAHTTLPMLRFVAVPFRGKVHCVRSARVVLWRLSCWPSEPLCRNPDVHVDQPTSWFLNVSRGHG